MVDQNPDLIVRNDHQQAVFGGKNQRRSRSTIDDGHLSPSTQAALSLHTELRVTEPEDMTAAKLNRLRVQIGNLAGLIADAYFV